MRALDREIDLELVLFCHDCLGNLPAKMQWKNRFLKEEDKIILHVNGKSVLCHAKIAKISTFCIPKGLWYLTLVDGTVLNCTINF